MAEITEYKEAYDAGVRAVLNRDEDGFVAVPSGSSIVDIEKYKESPNRIKQKHSFESVDSFILYFNKFKSKKSQIFASTKGGLIVTAVIDYHGVDDPAWGDHSITFAPRLSREWLSWTSTNKHWFTQREFMEFLEERAYCILKPEAAGVLELCSDLDIRKSIVYKSSIKLQNGDNEATFSETTEQGGKKKFVIPDSITVGMPVFENYEAVKIQAKLRYQANGEEGLKFQYLLDNPDQIVDDLRKKFLDDIGKKTVCNIYI